MLAEELGRHRARRYRAEHHAAQEFDRLLAHALGTLQVRAFVNSYYRKPSHGMLATAAWDLRDREVIYIADLDKLTAWPQLLRSAASWKRLSGALARRWSSATGPHYYYPLTLMLN